MENKAITSQPPLQTIPPAGQQRQRQQQQQPWYTDPNLSRNRARAFPSGDRDVRHAASSDASRYVLFHGTRRGAYHYTTTTTIEEEEEETVEPLWLRHVEVEELTSPALLDELTRGRLDLTSTEQGFLLVWIGERDGVYYWALKLPDDGEEQNFWATRLESLLQRRKQPQSRSASNHHNNSTTTTTTITARSSIRLAPVREFGDRLVDGTQAALLATANGLLEFHASHRYCSRCGGATTAVRAGACRQCRGCRRKVHPRMDAAMIVLVTSVCGEYALLGRKASWPQGRYSTLAGFAEVGETLEHCVVREVWEESGVEVDPTAVRFVASQPWPFPQSLMVGFQAKVVGVAGKAGELPEPRCPTEELEDVRWFSREYIQQQLEAGGGSTALTFEPQGQEAEFHMPGRASLARLLIRQWATNDEKRRSEKPQIG